MKNKKKVITSVLLLSTLGMGLASCNPSETGSSSSSESSAITESKYKVETVSNADVEISTDVAEAKEGDTVTITVTLLNEEKVLDAILVNGKSDGVTEVTKGSKYTYVVGKEDIKVTAQLSDKVYENHPITINSVEGFSVSFRVGDAEASATGSAKKGDLVTVLIDVTNDTHRFKEITSGDVTLSLSKNEGAHIEETFIMIDKEVSLNLVSEAIPTHSLSAIASEGMSVKFFYKDQEVTEGIEGKETHVKISLEAKHAFASISAQNESLNLTTIEEGVEYSFVMPTEAVVLMATCNKIVDKYTITDVQTCGGVTITSGLEKGAKLDEESTVTVKFSYTNKKDGNYTLSYGAYINNDLVMATLDEATMTGEITFTMPSKDATVYVGPFIEPLSEDNGNAVKVVLPELSSDYKIFGIKNGWYDLGGQYSYPSIKIYLLTKKEFVVSRFTYVNKYGTDTSMSINNGYYPLPIYNIEKGGSTEVKVTGSIKELRTITFTDIDKVDIEGDYSSVPEGTTVSLTIKPKAGYGLNAGSYPYNIVKSYSYGDKTSGISFSWSSYSNILSFTMPDADLTITLNIVEQVALTVANPEALKSYKFTKSYYSSSDEVTSITGGTTVYFWPVAKDGEKIKNVFLNDSTEPLKAQGSSSSAYYAITAPETGTVSLTIETLALHTFTAESTDQYQVSSVSSQSNGEGDEVAFKLVRKIGYKVTKVALSNGTEVSLKSGSVDTYSFVMPNEDVSLVVTTEVVSTVTMTVSTDEPFSQYHVRDIYGTEVTNGGALNVGETYSISFYNKNGYSITGITLSEGEATKENDTKYSFVAPSSNLTITPDFTESEKHTITIANEDTEHYVITSILDDGYSVSTTGTIYGYVGHSIRIRISSNDNSSKIRYFANAKIVNASTGETVTSNVATQDEDTLNLSFIMPSFDVKLQFDIAEKQTRQIIKGENAGMFKICDKSFNGNELDSFVAGAKLYISLNLTDYQAAFYTSFKIQYSYTLDGQLTTKEETFSYTGSTITIQSAPDADITFNLVVTEPTEKVTVKKEDNDQKSKLVILSQYWSDNDKDFGDSFEFGKGKQLYAKLINYESSDFTNGKYVITITNSETSEVVKTYEITSSSSSVSKYVSFTASANLTVSLTYVAK